MHPPATGPLAGWRPDLRRSVALFRAFRHEQDDPQRFYQALSRDSVAQLSQWVDLRHKTVLDVGGGPGHFRADFAARGATCVVVDPDPDEIYSYGPPAGLTVRGDGMRMPVRSHSVDVCFSSNALEHVRDPEAFAEEMLRVTRPGGIIYLSYTNWLSPNGGHETGPWHLLMGGRRAAERYAVKRGHRPKNDFGRSLFPVSAARMIRWSRRAEAAGRAEVVAVLPRYHPRRLQPIVRVPGVRELLSWNLLIVMRPRVP